MTISVSARLNYAVHQGLRVSKFLTQALVGNLALGRRPTKEQQKTLPPISEFLIDLKRLFEMDLENITAGLYQMPDDDLGDTLVFSKNSIRFFLDLIKVKQRQTDKNVSEAADRVKPDEFPKYFTQNFHYQTDGYLSEHSADLYDHQVELVFAGGGDAMRRQALVPLYHYLKSQKNERLALLDVGCGTGRFLREVKKNFPSLRLTGVDLSPWYLKKARSLLQKETHVNLVEANAESLPFKDAQFDVITSVFVFHELPHRVREIVVSEMARVLKPGGKLIFVESIQVGDKPRFDASLALFPVNYHEPYYKDYVNHDLKDLFTSRGFELANDDTVQLAFFSKIITFTRAGTMATAAVDKAVKKPRAKRKSKTSAAEV